MARLGEFVLRSVAAVAMVATPLVAHAQSQTPSIHGQVWIAYAIVGGLVLLVLLLISGVMNVSKRGDSSDDSGGLPFFGGDDDDDDKPRRAAPLSVSERAGRTSGHRSSTARFGRGGSSARSAWPTLRSNISP